LTDTGKLTLNEEARSYLETRPLRPPFWECDLDELREQMREECIAGGGDPEPVASIDDVDAGGVPARLYRAEDAGRDGFVWIHGGGWMLGDLDGYDSLVRYLANRAGCAVLSIDYRLAPENPFPAAIEDAWAATLWASAQFDRVAVGGDSAGGNLAASVALRCRDRGFALTHQVLVYPALDSAVYSDFYRTFKETYRDFCPGDFGAESQEGIRRVWELYVPDPLQRVHPDAAPMRAASLAGVAPATIITAEHDILRGEAEGYARRLTSDGVVVEIIQYDGQLHGFFGLVGVIADARDAAAKAATALRRAFATSIRAETPL